MRNTVLAFLCCFMLASVAFGQGASVTLERGGFRYTIGPDGKNLSFIDVKSGTDYLVKNADSWCASVRSGGKDYHASSAAFVAGKLTLGFEGSGVSAVIGVKPMERYLILEVLEVRGDIESLMFLNIPLTLRGKPDEPFGACALTLNLFTRSDQLPALMTHLQASCYPKFGVKGAKVALIGEPLSGILAVLREALSADDEMPHSTVAGPWAQETLFNHGSYLFNFGTLTEQTLPDWIDMAKSLGVTQIDNHGGSAQFFKFGDFDLNRDKFPQGWDTYKDIVARLHKEGIGSIFHTYAFFIDKSSKYVSPVPSPYLDAFRTLTLANAVGPADTVLTVNESTKGMNTVTGFFEHNSVVLHIGDELVTFSGVSQEPPYRFTGVTRGALGTKAAAHDKGAKARHLKECFGLFVPDVDSPLFVEIAKNIADVVNQCDFDGIYLDAIDGCSILRGDEECWYWGDKFVFEIAKNVKKPIGMEMSAMWHHCWQFRTRWQAWDYPQRGQKRFIDQHADGVNGGLLLPLHFGWWNFQVFDPPQVEPSFPDVIEYLGAKMIGWDAGISLTGAIDRENLKKIPAFQRAVGILRTCEELRRSHYFDDSVRAKLREPGKEFTLFKDDAGEWRFRSAKYETHKVESAAVWSSAWKTENPFTVQPVKLRIEALMSVGAYDSPDAVTLADCAKADMFGAERKAADGLAFDLKPTVEKVKTGGASGLLTVTSDGKTPRNASWARLDRNFQPVLDLSKQQALGVWVYGDGQGEILAFRLDSPKSISFGALADRYVTVDFTGWRYCELVETESSRWGDYVWKDGKGGYNIFRETIDFGHVESFGLWMNNVPAGKEVRCYVSPVKALPMVSNTLRNPTVTVGGKTIVFPVEMKSGSYIEFNSASDCKLYGPNGEFLQDVKPKGVAPILKTGANAVKFSCTGAPGLTPRANVTVISHGGAL